MSNAVSRAGPPPAPTIPWSAASARSPDEYDYRVDEIDGRVPAALRGTLFRNGSGRNDLGGHWFPHWFDGDGMISAIRFDDAGIRYLNRYVRTENYRDETRAGRIVHRGFGKMRPGGVIGNAFRQPANVSNISVVHGRRRLLSLWEGGAALRARSRARSTTLGLEDFGGQVERLLGASRRSIRATGELFNFGIDYGRKTTLTPYRTDRRAISRALPPIDAALSGDEPRLRADAANYLVFCLGPILVHPLKMLLGLHQLRRRAAMGWRRPTLILLVPRDGARRPRWIETEPFFQFHFANGFEEDGALVLDLTRYPDYATVGDALRNYWHSDWSARRHGRAGAAAVDLADRTVVRQAFATGNANEFPRINPQLCRRPPSLCVHRQQSAGSGQRPAAAHHPRRPRQRRRPIRTISARTAIRASRCSFRRAPAARKMTVSWLRWFRRDRSRTRYRRPRRARPGGSAAVRCAAEASRAVLAARHLHAPVVWHMKARPERHTGQARFPPPELFNEC